MRVISQNRKSDIPYEYFAFSIVSNGNSYSIIATKNIAEPPEVIMNSIFATYSTKEKAIKAMEALRETYMHPYIRYFQFPKDDEVEN